MQNSFRPWASVLYVLAIHLMVMACAPLQSPTLKSVQNLRTTQLNNHVMQLEADALFANPNDGSLNMTGLVLDLRVNDKLVAIINQRDAIKIKGYSDFDIPLQAEVSVDQFADLTLRNVGSFFSGKALIIDISGFLRIKRFGVGQKIPIHYTQEVDPSFFSPF